MASALGIDTDWRLLHGTIEFFTIAKALHTRNTAFTMTAVAPKWLSATPRTG